MLKTKNTPATASTPAASAAASALSKLKFRVLTIVKPVRTGNFTKSALPRISFVKPPKAKHFNGILSPKGLEAVQTATKATWFAPQLSEDGAMLMLTPFYPPKDSEPGDEVLTDSYFKLNIRQGKAGGAALSGLGHSLEAVGRVHSGSAVITVEGSKSETVIYADLSNVFSLGDADEAEPAAEEEAEAEEEVEEAQEEAE